MLKGDEARVALIDAAMQEASRIGLAAVTLAPVAKRAGWSKGGLLRHFPTRESLQLAVVHRATERFRQHVILPALSSKSGGPRLRAIFRNWLQFAIRSDLEGGCPLNAARLEFDDQPGEVRDAVAAAWQELLGYLEKQAAKAIEQREVSTECSARQVAMLITGLILACDSAARLFGDRHAVRDAERTFELLFPAKSSH
ncbi:MAG TPA: TetR/AcrR family transcriptional regulator [Burkholderiaceae bacterium]|jgi:AcrR family transcriptional regulator|nr:TetR/AcrR family transcriptional regulator [Burkholderiaceae bacterium]